MICHDITIKWLVLSHIVPIPSGNQTWPWTCPSGKEFPVTFDDTMGAPQLCALVHKPHEPSRNICFQQTILGGISQLRKLNPRKSLNKNHQIPMKSLWFHRPILGSPPCNTLPFSFTCCISCQRFCCAFSARCRCCRRCWCLGSPEKGRGRWTRNWPIMGDLYIYPLNNLSGIYETILVI